MRIKNVISLQGDLESMNKVTWLCLCKRTVYKCSTHADGQFALQIIVNQLLLHPTSSTNVEHTFTQLFDMIFIVLTRELLDLYFKLLFLLSQIVIDFYKWPDDLLPLSAD